MLDFAGSVPAVVHGYNRRMVALPVSMQILTDTPNHRVMVNAVLQAATDYHLLVEGAPPTAEHVDEFFRSLPPGYSADDHFPLGFFAGDTPIGVGGILRKWNAPHKAMVGLLVLAPEWRRGGHGRKAFGLIETLARTWPGIRQLRVGVVGTNRDALIFWRKVGFIDTGEIKPKYGPFVDDIVILEKPLYVNPSEAS